MRTHNITSLTPQFLDALKKEMERAGVTPKDIAERLGISFPSAYAWFNGRSKGIKKTHLKILYEIFPRIPQNMVEDIVEMPKEDRTLIEATQVIVKRNLISAIVHTQDFEEEEKMKTASIIKNRHLLPSISNDVNGITEIYKDIVFAIVEKGDYTKEMLDFLMRQFRLEVDSFLDFYHAIKELSKQE